MTKIRKALKKGAILIISEPIHENGSYLNETFGQSLVERKLSFYEEFFGDNGLKNFAVLKKKVIKND